MSADFGPGVVAGVIDAPEPEMPGSGILTPLISCARGPPFNTALNATKNVDIVQDFTHGSDLLAVLDAGPAA
jgi:hypothetical protein